MDILSWVLDNWQSIAGIFGAIVGLWGVIGKTRRDKIRDVFNKSVQESEIDKTIKSNVLDSKDKSMELVEKFEDIIIDHQGQIIELREMVLQLNKEKHEAELENESFRNDVKTAFIKMLRMCEIMCGEKEKCKGQVREIMKELNFKEDDNAAEVIN